jgi:hypothetical protein
MQFTEKRLRVKWYGRLDVAWLAMSVLVQTAVPALGRGALGVLVAAPPRGAGIHGRIQRHVTRRKATPGLPGDSNRRRMLEGPEKIHTRHLLPFCYKGSRYE